MWLVVPGITGVLHKIYTDPAAWTCKQGQGFPLPPFCNLQHCVAHFKCSVSYSDSEYQLMLARPYVLITAAPLEHSLRLRAG
jgi:hypothetical protein